MQRKDREKEDSQDRYGITRTLISFGWVKAVMVIVVVTKEKDCQSRSRVSGSHGIVQCVQGGKLSREEG
jgi:hypothetical protein